jgi:hypothetical protein
MKMKLIQLFRFVLIFAFFIQSPTYAKNKQLLARPQFREKAVASEQGDYDAFSTEVVAQYTYELMESLNVALQQILGQLERSSLYWQWCVDHSVRYALSKSPMKWLRGGAQSSELHTKQSEVQMLLHGYNVQYGRLVRHQGAFEACINDQEREAWVHESMNMIWSSISPRSSWSPLLPPQDPHFLDSTLGRNALKQRVNESIACMYASIKPVAVPSHWVRNWLPYTIAGVGMAALFGVCYKNQDALCEGMHTIAEAANNGFNTQIRSRFLELKEEISSILWPSENLTKTAIEGWREKLRVCQNYFNGDASKPKGSYVPLVGSTIDHVNNTINDGRQAIGIAIGVGNDMMEHYTQQFDREAKAQILNVRLIALIPALLVTYPLYGIGYGIKHWFSKRDRRMLRARLWQANDILIRADGELSDEEYGKLLYVLHKENEQAQKNVDSKEYNAFFEDLCYLALPSSTVQQKKETIMNMWHKYQALKDV